VAPVLVAVPLTLALALGWAAAAPTPLAVRAGEVLVSEELPEFEAAQDGIYAVLAVLAGLVHGGVLLAARWVERPAAAVGALAGATLGSLVASRVGAALGPAPVATGDGAEPVRAPLDLEAYGLLGLWPAVLATVLFAGLLVMGLSAGDRGDRRLRQADQVR
jgi:hypothetical protein